MNTFNSLLLGVGKEKKGKKRGRSGRSSSIDFNCRRKRALLIVFKSGVNNFVDVTIAIPERVSSPSTVNLGSTAFAILERKLIVAFA